MKVACAVRVFAEELDEFRDTRRKFDAKHISLLEKDGHVLKDAVHKEYCILLGFCQSARIAATIENGSITNAKWRRKLARWLSATDWNLLHKVSGSALSTLEEVRSLKGLDRADAFISYAAKKEASQHVAKVRLRRDCGNVRAPMDGDPIVNASTPS